MPPTDSFTNVGNLLSSESESFFYADTCFLIAGIQDAINLKISDSPYANLCPNLMTDIFKNGAIIASRHSYDEIGNAIRGHVISEFKKKYSQRIKNTKECFDIDPTLNAQIASYVDSLVGALEMNPGFLGFGFGDNSTEFKRHAVYLGGKYNIEGNDMHHLLNAKKEGIPNFITIDKDFIKRINDPDLNIFVPEQMINDNKGSIISSTTNIILPSTTSNKY